MKIKFCGAAKTVTGSQHLISVNGKNILLDCGLYQGKRKEAYEINRNFLFDPKEIDYVILSHAHIDHSGNIPTLVQKGYNGQIFATPATADLLEYMLRDAGHIQEYDVKYVNKKRKKQGKTLFEPLYTELDAVEALKHFAPVQYEITFQVCEGVMATFHEAGHILGSASIELDITENGKKTKLWFSGDIGRYNLPILKDPIYPKDADILLMENTYGDMEHPEPQAGEDDLGKYLSETLNNGGKVIIPAFAVGRTQELVYAIHRLMDAGKIPQVPVYVDSPLAVNATDVFRKNRSVFDEEAWKMIESDEHMAALGFDLLTYVRSVEESKALNFREDPMIIISASGMAEAGRILHHLKNNIENEKNMILIVGWQAPDTLGRRLMEGERNIKIFGEAYYRKAQVATIHAFSAHAGQDELTNYAISTKDTVKKIFLVHGDEETAIIFKDHLAQKGITNVEIPSPGAEFMI